MRHRRTVLSNANERQLSAKPPCVLGDNEVIQEFQLVYGDLIEHLNINTHLSSRVLARYSLSMRLSILFLTRSGMMRNDKVQTTKFWYIVNIFITHLSSGVLARYSLSMRLSIRFLISSGIGTKRLLRRSVTSEMRVLWGRTRRAFMMRTMAASISCFRSSSTFTLHFRFI